MARKNAIAEYLRLSDTRYSAKGPKGNGNMQAVKRD